MADVTTIGLVVGTSTLINTVYAAQHKASPITPLVAGGVSYVALALVGSLTGRMDVALALAWLFLVSALILHGTKINLGISSIGKKK